jgi:hypothetical protein
MEAGQERKAMRMDLDLEAFFECCPIRWAIRGISPLRAAAFKRIARAPAAPPYWLLLFLPF